MKKIRIIRIICLFLIVLLVTGCEVNYELNFTDSDLDEKISIILSENESTDENFEIMDYRVKNEGFAKSSGKDQELYTYNRTNNKGVLSYKYNVNDFSENHSIDQCYDSFNFVPTDDGYLLITSDVFRCGYFDYIPVDKYNIIITTNREVLDNNADRIEGNKYIWEIETNGNVDIEKPIKIKFSNKTQKDLLRDKLSSNDSYVLAAILGILLLGIVTIFIIFTIKSRRNQN